MKRNVNFYLKLNDYYNDNEMVIMIEKEYKDN